MAYLGTVRVEQLSKRFGATPVLHAIDLTVHSGELLTLLGPSGCGKTTLLRLLAGLEKPDHGAIYLGGSRVDQEPTHRRNIGMVFQNYAVFPHLTIADNVAYGLRAQKLPASQIKQRVSESLALVQLSDYGHRRPDQLSGGQQQRVALARSLATQPTVLLMDEPLSNLDTRLRDIMRAEIRRLQKQIGITTIYVTHDHREALAISDRIAVMDAGRLQQVAEPSVIYRQPHNRMVAAFVGSCSFVDVQVQSQEVHVSGSRFPRQFQAPITGMVSMGLRPESLILLSPGQDVADRIIVAGVLEEEGFQGASSQVQIRLPTGELLTTFTTAPPGSIPLGSAVRLGFHPQEAMFFDRTSGAALR